MFLEEAMSAHLIWKSHMERMIANEAGFCADLTSATARNPDSCALGRWITAEAARYADFPEFRELTQAHAEFHAHAADVLERIESGDKEGALVLKAGPFQASSREIIKALYGLRDRGAHL